MLFLHPGLRQQAKTSICKEKITGINNVKILFLPEPNRDAAQMTRCVQASEP